MKKLMITMLAASAVSAAAWAEGEVTFTSVNFNQTDEGQLNVASPWSYSGTATADQLNVAQGGIGQASRYLQLNTASEKLSLAPTSAGEYAVESEVYFDSYVKFDAASDTIPSVADGDKLALFVLDNTDYVESGATTAFYVIGGYWDGSKLAKRLYKLNSSIANLDQFKRVSIKMYSNVLAAGAVPGFVVKIGSDIAEVIAAYNIAEDGSVDFSQQANLFDYKTYLGEVSAFNPAVAASRYDSDTAQLILGLVASANPELEAVQFMGKGGIDDLAFTNVKNSYDFDADVQLFTIDLPANVLSVKYGEDTYTSAFDITATGKKVNMTITLRDGYYYNNANPAIIEVELTAGKKLSDLIKAGDLVLGVAKVGSTVYAREAFLGEGDFYNNGVTENMQLLSDLDLGAYGITFVEDGQLDLNGKTIGNDGTMEVVYAQNGAEVTIVGNGIVNGVVAAADGSKISIPANSKAKFLATVNDATVNDAAALADMLIDKDATKNYAFVEDATGYFVLQVTDMPVVYTITFMLGGASWAQDYDDYPTSYIKGTGVELPVAANLVKDGFEFAGWYGTADFTDDVITAIGTDATGNKTFYAKWTKVQEEIAPGGSTEVEATSPEEAVSKVTVTVPPEVSTEFNKIPDITADEIAELNTGYKALFDVKATYNETSGMYDVTIELKEKVVEAIQEAVDTAATDIAEALTSATDNSVEITTKPGLWYGVVEQDTLNGINTANPKSWTLGNGKAKTFTFEKAGNSGFYKVKVSVTK